MRLILLAALLVGCKKAIPPESAAHDPSTAPLPVDESVRIGRLDNGLSYFIERNTKPANRAVLRLAVDAGSLLEEDGQVGVAHFLEHMAFNGTESFPGNELITYLESVGTAFGPHLNAHTSFDETVYKLTVPTDDAEVFDKGLSVLKEWACCLTLDPAEIESERGVVLEEWRLRQGLRQRVTDAQFPLIYWGSRYPDRLPIGTEDNLESFDPPVVGEFYQDWYRPDLMAVIVAGDVDVDAVEATIRERFSDLKNPEQPRERERFDIPEQEEPLYLVFSDPEITMPSISVISKMDDPQAETIGDWWERQAGQLSLAALRERLAERAREPDSPLLGAGAGRNRMSPTEGSDNLLINPKRGRELEALELVLLEVKRFQQYGVLEPELARAKATTLQAMENYARNAEDTDSRVAADEIVRHFLQNEPMPGTLPEAALTKEATLGLTLEEVNAAAKGFLSSGSRVTLLLLPGDREDAVTMDEVRAVEDAVALAEVEAPVTEATVEQLVEAPAAGEIVERDSALAETLGVEQLVLSNRTRVYLKRTDFKKGEVVFRAWRRGGTDAVPDADDAFLNAWGSSSIRAESGLGEHDRGAVNRYLSDKTVRVSADLGDDRTGISGSARAEDLPVALEVAYLFETAPRFSEEGFERAMTSWRERLRDARKNPDRQYADAWRSLFWPDDPQRAVIDVERLDAVDLDAAHGVWTQAMGSPEEWTWFFVGDLPEDFESEVSTWLGAIPKTEPGFEYVDRGYHRKPGVFREVLEIGSADRARYRTEFWSVVEPGVDKLRWQQDLSAFNDILSVRLREKLREDLGGVYGVRASSVAWWEPYSGVRTRIEFQCDPERIDELEAAMMGVIEDLRDHPVPESYVDAEKAKNREWHEDSIETNGRWLWGVSERIREGDDPTEILKYLEYNEQLTPERVQQFAKERLTGENRGTLILMPKGE